MKKLKRVYSLYLLLFLLSILLVCLFVIDRRFQYCIIYLLLSAIIIIGVFLILGDYGMILTMAPIIIYTVLFIIRFESIDRMHEEVNIYHNKNSEFCGYISDYPTITNNQSKFRFYVTHVKLGTSFVSIKEFNVLVKCPNNSEFYRWETLSIKGKFFIPENKTKDGFNYLRYLYSRNIFGIIKCRDGDVIKIEKNILSSQNLKIFSCFRKSIVEMLHARYSEEALSFLLSIFFGDRSLLDEEIESSYRDSGMVHLLAISGFHIGFIGLIFFTVFSLLFPNDVSKIISSLILLLYILLLNDSASSMRAFLMYFIQSLYFYSGNQSSKFTPISLSGIIMIINNPYCIFDTGFILSFTATAGILLYFDFFDEILKNVCHEKIRSSLSVSLSAFIVTFLIQASLFSRISIVSIISGLIIIPIFSLLFIGLFIAVFFIIISGVEFLDPVINFSIHVFNKMIMLLALIKPVSANFIKIYTPYLFSVVIFFLIYIIPEIFKIINRKMKIIKIDKTFREFET